MIFNLCPDLWSPLSLQETTKAELNEVGGIFPINTKSLKEGSWGFFHKINKNVI